MKTAIFCMTALLGAASLCPGPAVAAGGESETGSSPVSTLETTYQLYVGGITLGRVELSARVADGRYSAVSTLETLGVVNAFWRARIEASSSGSVDLDAMRPALYDAFSRHDATSSPEGQRVTVRQDEDGIAHVDARPRYSDEDSLVFTKDQKAQTLDPVSAMVFFATSATANRKEPCGLTAPVFDGRRRYDVSLSFEKSTIIRMDNGLYKGPVDVCELRYHQIAGAGQNVVENVSFPKVSGWVATIPSANQNGSTYLLPLRIWAETEYGIVVALATRIKIDGFDIREGD